jgi:hypothetical protein
MESICGLVAGEFYSICWINPIYWIFGLLGTRSPLILLWFRIHLSAGLSGLYFDRHLVPWPHGESTHCQAFGPGASIHRPGLTISQPIFTTANH